MPFYIVRKDITKMPVDVIVNATDTDLQTNFGISGAIFRAAGAEQLQAACNKLAPVEPGKAVITSGFNLPAKYIIHTPGNIYKDGNSDDAIKLRNCYLNSLMLALEYGCKSIAFPLLPNDIYRYHNGDALGVGMRAINKFLSRENMIDVYLVLFDRASLIVGPQLLSAVASYVGSHFVIASFYQGPVDKPKLEPELLKQLDNAVDNLAESFSQTLLRLIDTRGKTHAKTYQNANIDRRLFSKIKNGKGYMPSKRTVIALAIALELSLTETNELLKQAGYSLTNNQKLDVIVTFFIINGRYDIFEINEVLLYYGQPLLGE